MLNKDEFNRLYRYAFSLVQNEDGAFDILQNSLENFLASNKDHVKEPLHYLMRSIRNGFLDKMRKDKLHLVKSDELLLHQGTMELSSLEDIIIDRREVEYMLHELAVDEREILYLWAVEEFTVQEIADMQNKPKGTLLSKLHRLKQKIRDKYHYRDHVTQEDLL